MKRVLFTLKRAETLETLMSVRKTDDNAVR